MNFKIAIVPALLCFAILGACSGNDSPDDNEGQPEVPSSPNNGSIALPSGFNAVVVADDLGNARHLTVNSNGDVYVKLGSTNKGGSIVALRDEDGDGRADRKEFFEDEGGTGITIHGEYLYYASNTQVFRRKFNGNELVPEGNEELIVTLPDQQSHAAKSLALDNDGYLYVNVGAPSNACQDPSRTAGTPGQDPCPQLDNHGGIWRFSAMQTNQQQSDGIRYATGIRNAVGIDWNEGTDRLYVMQHGRDQLHQFWPELYTEQDNAELPAEEMFEVQEGDNFGWPYCYYDHLKEQKVLSPEYGGDGDTVGRCDQFEDPIMAFPGHWAPNDIQFYHKNHFPQKYRDGAFIAFHGSWNRAPLPQQGYKVVFVPFSGGKPTGNYEDFATEFANDGGEVSGGAEYRPCGLAVGPDGSLYIADSVEGRIWKVSYSES